MNEGIEFLTNKFKDKDWFCEVGLDNIGRYVVYVKYSCMETLTLEPDMLFGKQVLVAFIRSKTARAEDFTTNATRVPFAKTVDDLVGDILAPQEIGDEIEELSSDVLEIDIEDLTDELDRLERLCGTNALQDIFYEIQDGNDSVTNLSARYPDVRVSLEQLYEKYGFDLIYEELDG
jgi:hypothetical protein